MAEPTEAEILAKGKLVSGSTSTESSSASSGLPSEAEIMAAGKPVSATPQPVAEQSGLTRFVKDIPRQVGLTGRYALEGLGSALDIGTAPIAAGLNTIGDMITPNHIHYAPSSQAGAALADYIGLPKPQNGVERVVGNAARGGFSAMTGAGVANTAAKFATNPTVSGILSSMAANPVAQTAGTAIGSGAGQTATELGANPLLAAGIDLAATGIATPLGIKAGNASAGRFTPAGAQAMALNDKAKAQGVTLSAGDLGNPTAKMVENFLQDLPFSGRDKFMQEQALQTKAMLTRAEAATVGQRDPGQDMIKALRDSYAAKNTTANGFYNTVKTELAKVPGSDTIPVPDFAAKAKEFMRQYPGYLNSSDVSEDVKSMLRAAKNGTLADLPYDQARKVRTLIGNELADARSSDKTTLAGELSQLYKGIATDSSNWASSLAGTNPTAKTALNQADKYWIDNIRPFRNSELPQVRKIVRSTTSPEALGVLADNVIGSNFRSGKVAKAEAVMNLGGQPGVEAAQRGLLDRAFGVGLDPNTNAGVSPMRFVNTLDMADPMTAAVMGRPSPVMQGVQDMSDIAQATRRSVSAFETPRTGVQNKAIGTLVGLLNPATTLQTAAGLVGGRAAGAALRTDPVKGLLFSDYNPYANAFPLLNAYQYQPQK